MPRVLPEDVKNDIKVALLHRREPSDIAKEPGIHAATVRRYRKRFSLQSPASAGRHSIIPDVGKRYIKLFVIRGQLKTAKKVYRKLTELGYSLSYRSAVSTLNELLHKIEEEKSCS